MKFKLSANADIDLLTKDEVQEVLTQNMRDALGGVLYRDIPLTFANAAPAIVTFSFTCQAGRMWDVRAIFVNKSATDVVQIWKQSVTPGSYRGTIADDGNKGNVQTYTKGSLIVQGGQTLVIQALTATGAAYATLSVKEVPAGHDFKL
jgi:hypothetical protein